MEMITDGTEQESLQSVLKGIIGKRRRFLLLRLCDVETADARGMCSATVSAYNGWVREERFKLVYQRREELSTTYKKEAMTMMRRENQLAAVMLEEKILKALVVEIDSGNFVLMKTQIAKEVYNKLMADLDITVVPSSMSFEQHYYNMTQNGIAQTPGPVTTDQVISEITDVIEEVTESVADQVEEDVNDKPDCS